MSVQFYSYKVEFQERGAPHIHGVLWLNMKDLENLSRIDGQLTKVVEGPDKPLKNISKTFSKLRTSAKLDNDDKTRLTCFIDSFITVSLHSNSVGEDVARIAKTVNEHKCSRTCFKKGGFCRFHYPKPPSPHTIIVEPIKMTNQEKKWSTSKGIWSLVE